LKISRIWISFFFFFTIVFSQFSIAQDSRVPNLKYHDYEPYFFGFILAANQMDFIINTSDDFQQMTFPRDSLPTDLQLANVQSASVYGITSTPNLGFTVGIVGDLRLGKYFNFRFIPSLAFGNRILNYDIRLHKTDTFDTIVSNQKVSSTFIELPMLLKFRSARVHNFRAYVIGGVKYSFDLASQANKKDEIRNYDPKLYRTDTQITGGAGLDFFMNWFKFGVELTMSYGLRDMLLQEGTIYTNGIESLKSKIFMFTFTFEG
jgi:hypothetical protein